MSAIVPNPRQFQELAAAPDNSPVVMLNLLKFKKRADDGSGSGRESYNKYGQAVKPMVEALGGRMLWQGRAEQLLIGEQAEQGLGCRRARRVSFPKGVPRDGDEQADERHSPPP